LARQNIAHEDFLTILLQDLSTLTSHHFYDGLNEGSLARVDLTSKMCRSCRGSCLSRLVYAWRLNLPQDEIRNNWPHRPNCYYGRNCRTQHEDLVFEAGTLSIRRFVLCMNQRLNKMATTAAGEAPAANACTNGR
uniref:MYND-type domain-containing protein n=1 Tax=Schistocephalus solidus TaxID=70667 RepID=A0A183TGC5_SCHSO